MTRSILIFILCLAGIATAQQVYPLITQVSSNNLLEGEEATYQLIYRNQRPQTAPPTSINIGQGRQLELSDDGKQDLNGQRFYIYEYAITNLPEGSYRIPSLDLDFNGQQLKSEAIELQVMSVDSLTPNHFKIRDQQGNDSHISFYSKICTSKLTLYPGEAIPVDYKIYVPERMNPQGFGIPQPAELFNATAWRFSTPGSRRDLGRVNIKGVGYYVASYNTVLSALKPGDATFGPLETTLVLSPRTMTSRFGFTRVRNQEAPITSETLALEVIEFPSAAPAGFQGAVGDLNIEAELPSKTTLSTSDSIKARVTVSGKGNLSEITAPELNNPAAWKVIDVSKIEQDESRKKIKGSVQFSYLLQPLAAARQLPRFSLTHFNLPTKSWKSDTTQSSAVTITEAPRLATAAVVPAESMNDILAPLAQVDLSPTTQPKNPGFSPWLWQTIPATALVLILVIGSIRQRAANNTVPAEQRSAMKQLEQSQGADFLKAAANYANRWHPNSEAASELSKKRDQQCYTPGHNSTLGSEERKTILSSLKKLGILLAFIALIPQQLEANGFQSWQQQDFNKALTEYQQQQEKHPKSADLHYNIGCCHYRLGNFGKAAEHFFITLELNPQHYEAKKNLGFLQQSYASITNKEEHTINPWVRGFSPQRCLMLASTLALLALSALALRHFFASTLGSKRTLSALAISTGTLAVLALGICWIHPSHNLDEIASPNCIVIRSSALLTEPIQPTEIDVAKKTLIQANIASPVHMITSIDQWAYVELANGNRGWIDARSLSKPRD